MFRQATSYSPRLSAGEIGLEVAGSDVARRHRFH